MPPLCGQRLFWREEFAVEIEDDNRPPVHIDQLVRDRGSGRAGPSKRDPEKPSRLETAKNQASW
jgi:hypothetical protein